MKLVKETNSCDVIIGDIENSFSNFGNCLESVFDNKQTKMGVVKNLFKFGGSLTKLAFDTTSCAVKHAPKAIGAAANAKREVMNAVEDEWSEYQKEKRREALDRELKLLGL